MLSYALISVLEAHRSDLKKLAISIQGNGTPMLITCSRDGHIKGWSMDSIVRPRLEFDFAPHTGFVNALAAPEGTSNSG